MERKQKTIDIILEEFLENEVKATDHRIMSIRKFMEALQKEVAKYSSSTSESKDFIHKNTIAKLIDDMAEIYNEELSHLIAKRSKIYNHLTSVHIAICNGESARSKNLYLN